MAEARYAVDLDGLTRAFPPGAEPPSLLLDFATWLRDRRWGSVGTFDLAGSRADDAPIVDGSALRREFALFLHLPDGSVGGFWLPPGRTFASPAVIGLGSEGDAAVLGTSLEGFLARLALDRFGDGGAWSDFSPSPEDADDEDCGVPDERAALSAWLRERLGRRDIEALAAEPDDLGFRARMDAWTAEREAFWDRHPAMIELGRLLAAHRPRATVPWARTRFAFAVVGKRFEGRVFRRGPEPIPEADAVEPVLRALRNEQALADPDFGAWFSMELTLATEGSPHPRFDYDARPTIAGAPAPVEEAWADLLRFPRPSRWVPDWAAD